jgi:hypothetical protein
MPDHTLAGKRLHLERLVARGGDLTMDAARDLVDRVLAMHLEETRAALTQTVLLAAGMGAVLGFSFGALAGVVVW